MYILLLFLPLFNFLTLIAFGRFIGLNGSIRVLIFNVALSVILAILMLFDVALADCPCIVEVRPWILIDGLNIKWSFLFDSLSAVMFFIVSVVSGMVHLYSIDYMRHDPHIIRFLSYLSLFTFFMFFMVSAANYLILFFGWEGIGIASYLLINFWYTRMNANRAAIKAMLVNKVGDIALLLAIAVIYYFFETLDFSILYTLLFHFPEEFLTMNLIFFEVKFFDLLGILILIAAFGKSAQLFLHTWLPDAMEGPTPVSALIHAATLVTAGVFLVVRSSPILELSDVSLKILLIFGSITAIFAGTCGLFQYDIKKVVAYSTCSQLGYMFFACGMSCYSFAMFHLFTHAFFKALLFLSAGSVIHALHDEQDIRRMGALHKILPFTYTCFFLASLCLVGFPFLSGFYSKEPIFLMSLNNSFSESFIFHALILFSTFLTSLYSLRVLYLTSFSRPNGNRNIYENAHEAESFTVFAMCVLLFGSIFLGYFFKDLFIGLASPFWGNSIFSFYDFEVIVDLNFSSWKLGNIPIILNILAFLIIWVVENSRSTVFMFQKEIQNFLVFFHNKWYFDRIYYLNLIMPVLRIGYRNLYRLIDRGLIETLGPNGIKDMFSFLSLKTVKIQTGLIYHYAFVFLVSLIFLVLLIIVSFNFDVFTFFIDFELCFVVFYISFIIFLFKN